MDMGREAMVIWMVWIDRMSKEELHIRHGSQRFTKHFNPAVHHGKGIGAIFVSEMVDIGM